MFFSLFSADLRDVGGLVEVGRGHGLTDLDLADVDDAAATGLHRRAVCHCALCCAVLCCARVCTGVFFSLCVCVCDRCVARAVLARARCVHALRMYARASVSARLICTLARPMAHGVHV